MRSPDSVDWRAGLTWRASPFDGLTLIELDRIYNARQQVFCVEQQCAFVDADGLDEHAHHLWARSPALGAIVAYARVLEPGTKYAEPSMGRVLTLGLARGSGLGRELVRRALELSEARWPGAGNRISAQTRLESFYAAFGYRAAGAPYLEDGIHHTEMYRVGA
ncbi:MAG TPA: GNAT family N-acetyltransferase [Caldimonas sp.]|nr:GNAT family N-acetyltransferase [Caldimonas sp.]